MSSKRIGAGLEHAAARSVTEADQDIPDVRAGRTGMHEIAGAFERRAGIKLEEGALDVDATELRALDGRGVDDRPGILRRTIRSVGAGGEDRESLFRLQRARRGQREMRVAAAADRKSVV